MNSISNRILVVDDDTRIIGEYLRCLSADFEPDIATTTLGDLEKVLFGADTDQRGSARFDVDARKQGEAAVRAVGDAMRSGNPYSIVFLDIRMPPGIDGIEAAKQIRAVDPNVNIVIVTGSLGAEPENIGKEIPPADRVFFFKKPFHAIECRQLAAALCGKWNADLALRDANEKLEHRVRERTAALHLLAYQDPVTELPNRLKLLSELSAMVESCQGDKRAIAVVVLDIERFSFLNETMGYDAGTELLRAIGRRLADELAGLRRDAAGGPVVGRFGADEFACLVGCAAGEESLSAVVERVKSAVEEPFLINGRELFLKASIGVAWYPEHDNDAQRLFRFAEDALHRSMRRPEGRITWYSSEMGYRARHKFYMEAELRHALDTGQITAHFQPQVNLADGRLTGVEALARWMRADGSIVYPADFVPLSEEMGISDMLFETVLADVCESVRRWIDEDAWDTPVSVNLSAHQLRNDRLVATIRNTLRESMVEERLINLELTETVLLEDLTLARPVLRDLSDLGVGIHIDDFGTGYSSLSYLAELPVQTLKVDQSFVQKLAEAPANARVVQAIVALGKAMGLDVVAEGIETPEQMGIIRGIGCDLAQGFLICKPLAAGAFRDWCRARGTKVPDAAMFGDRSAALPNPV